MWKFKIAVQEQILVSDADLRDRRSEQQVSQSGQQFVEVNDQFGTALLDAAFDEPHTLQVGGQMQQVVDDAAWQVGPLVGGSGQEVGAFKTFDGGVYVAVEESRQSARLAFAYQYFHYFVSVASQHFFHADGLGQMPPPFSLYDKKNFHKSVPLKSCFGMFRLQVSRIL